MQIDSFVLYHHDGVRRRVLKLHSGLNVITGWRNTGKSSLLEIVDYCFGRSRLTVSRGKVRRTVGWYGLVIRDGERYAFAGRPAPREEAASTADAMWLPLSSSTPPDASELHANTNATALREQLSSFSGFGDVVFEPPVEAVRPALRLHVGHVLPVCMQDEEDIDSKTRLFHRGQEREVMQALRDSFAYLLGAADEYGPTLRSQLNGVKRELLQTERALARLQDAALDADERDLALLTQATSVGLATQPDSLERPPSAEVRAALRAASAVDPEERSSTVSAGEVEALLSRRRELHEQLARAERDEALLRDFGADRQAFTDETAEQRARLASIGLLDHDHDAARCPVCEHSLQEPDPSVAVLAEHLRQLDEELLSVAEIEPRDQQALLAASASTQAIRDQLSVINQTLRDLADRDRGAAAARTLASRRAYVQGAISEYLRTLSEDDPSAEQRMSEQIRGLEAERDELEQQLDTGAEAERLSGAINIVGAGMTQIARRLELEHSTGGQVRLDLGRMTLVADTVREGSFPLSDVGGAGTRVGYHLAAHLALHRLLRERGRPGPAFLLLDQPTGPFYPDDTREGEEPRLRHEDDRAIVASMFELLRDIAEELAGTLQIVVVDHARLGEDWFESATVENWRDGRGLIPDGWEEEPPEQLEAAT